jgi:tRNA threonylcarbamoyladenosine biosynthesis protein TsaE
VRKIYLSSSSLETIQTGERIGRKLRAGDVVAISGQLGTGKTVIVKGIARALGIKEDITSPTYTFVNGFHGDIDFYHFDMYRINDPEEVEDLGFFEYFSPESICVIEWADRVADLLPRKRVDIWIEKDPEKGSDHRKIAVIWSRCEDPGI